MNQPPAPGLARTKPAARTQTMPFDEDLARRVREVVAEDCPVTERRMFGGLAFMVNGRMCCGIVGEDLVVRVGAAMYKQALSQTHARAMDFTGRPMKGFVYVGEPGYRDSKSKEVGSKGAALCLITSSEMN